MKSVLGVTLGHDTSFAHIMDGKVVGIMEAERYFRQKRYKLHCLTLEPGKHVSGYQYVSLEDMELFLGLVAKEGERNLMALPSKMRAGWRNLIISREFLRSWDSSLGQRIMLIIT